jgi:hypothetical protein
MDVIEEMEHIARRIKSYDAQIKIYVDELCPKFLSIPGVGYTTAGLISYSGIDVTVYESGKYKAKNCMPSKKGSKYLRYALFQVSRIIWQHDPVFRTYYQKKQAEGKHYYVILGHIQKKVVRVVYSILKNGTSYNSISLT